MFWRRKEIEHCKHEWVLNDIYGQPINCGVEVIIEDKFVLYCNNCKSEKEVDEFDYKRMLKYNLIKGD